MRLLWEAATSEQGGFVLRVADSSGKGLPDTLFGKGVEGKVRLLVRLRSQVAAAGAAAQPMLLPFNNCVILGDAIDPNSDRLAVQARSREVAAGDTAASIAASLGIDTATLMTANAKVAGQTNCGWPCAFK